MYVFGCRYLGDGDTDQREILHDGRFGPGHEVPPFVGYPKRPPKSQILTANILKRQVATLHVKWA